MSIDELPSGDELNAIEAELDDEIGYRAGDDDEFVVDPHFVEDNLWHAIARINQFEHALRV